MGVYRSSPRVYEHLEDPRNVADVLADMGVIYFETGDCNLALGHFERAFNLAEAIQYEGVMANVLNNLSIISAIQGCHDTALVYSQDCLARYKRLGDEYGSAQAHNNLGLIYLEKKDWHRALDHMEKGLAISQRIGSSSLTATIYINKADFNVRCFDFDVASHFCEIASRLFDGSNDHRGLAEIEKISGIIDAERKELCAAQQHLERALDLTRRYGTCFGTAEVYRELGSVYRKRKFRRKARAALEESLERYERLGAKERASHVRRELALLRRS